MDKINLIRGHTVQKLINIFNENGYTDEKWTVVCKKLEHGCCMKVLKTYDITLTQPINASDINAFQKVYDIVVVNFLQNFSDGNCGWSFSRSARGKVSDAYYWF